ncbi:hypothetical protein [Halococcoides cellulosivorans]|uniref:Uncharacterized protein n=1 Tax=Halococcoides cellulosivorans TaxID=1679096 RepID=A0A2R4WZM7_9EURY|nr:hypothetical protein [Halococcoides cellulosivorans]AWB27008.1 hypothetical protein HARCEL1_04430 [Halococcoides cellulosivorans]
MSSSTIDGPIDHVRGSPRRVIPTIRALAFWLAITLPLVQVAWLIVGLDGLTDLFVFVTLLGVNATSLAIGHTYAAPTSTTSSPDANP